jgi:hypothetical protein
MKESDLPLFVDRLSRSSRVWRPFLWVALACMVASLACCDSTNARSSEPTADYSSGLIALYHFDGNANDSSGSGYDGIVSGATLSTDRFGNPNSAFSFDGTSSRITTIPVANLPSSLTVSCWLYPTVLDRQIWGSVLRPSGGKNGFATFLGANGQLWMTYYKGNLDYGDISSSTGLSFLNQWIHIAYTVDGSGSVNIYCNGNQVGSGSIVHAPDASDVALTLGISILQQTQYFFAGKIDEVRAYNRALSATDIQAMFCAGG